MSQNLGPNRTPLDVLNYEIVEEQASALGRMGRALEAALARLREFDATSTGSGAREPTRQIRRRLVLEAGQALWMLVVQREACGLRDSRALMRTYRVPDEVQRNMGAPSFASLSSRAQSARDL